MTDLIDWMDEVTQTLKNIEESMTEMVDVMKLTLKGVAEWRTEDNIHHKEENNLIKKTFKDKPT